MLTDVRHVVPRSGLAPIGRQQDQDASTTVDMWAEWAKINVTLGFTAPVFWRVVRTAPDKREAGSIKAAVASLTKWLDIAETRLASRTYLTSDDFTLADIQFGHVLYRYYDIDIERAELPHCGRTSNG
jgi:glutathione S-transferase